MAVAAVERRRPAARPQIGERIGMGADEIGDVNVIADASAVGNRVIGAKHVHPGPFTKSRLHRHLDEVGRALGGLAGAQRGVGAGRSVCRSTFGTRPGGKSEAVPKLERVLRWDGTDWVITGLVSDSATIIKQGKQRCDFQETLACAHGHTKWLDREIHLYLRWIDLGERLIARPWVWPWLLVVSVRGTNASADKPNYADFIGSSEDTGSLP